MERSGREGRLSGGTAYGEAGKCGRQRGRGGNEHISAEGGSILGAGWCGGEVEGECDEMEAGGLEGGWDGLIWDVELSGETASRLRVGALVCTGVTGRGGDSSWLREEAGRASEGGLLSEERLWGLMSEGGRGVGGRWGVKECAGDEVCGRGGWSEVSGGAAEGCGALNSSPEKQASSGSESGVDWGEVVGAAEGGWVLNSPSEKLALSESESEEVSGAVMRMGLNEGSP